MVVSFQEELNNLYSVVEMDPPNSSIILIVSALHLPVRLPRLGVQLLRRDAQWGSSGWRLELPSATGPVAFLTALETKQPAPGSPAPSAKAVKHEPQIKYSLRQGGQ